MTFYHRAERQGQRSDRHEPFKYHLTYAFADETVDPRVRAAKRHVAIEAVGRPWLETKGWRGTRHLAANTVEPNFATPERPSKFDPIAEELARWLKTKAGKAPNEPRTVRQLHADLVGLALPARRPGS